MKHTTNSTAVKIETGQNAFMNFLVHRSNACNAYVHVHVACVVVIDQYKTKQQQQHHRKKSLAVQLIQ